MTTEHATTKKTDAQLWRDSDGATLPAWKTGMSAITETVAILERVGAAGARVSEIAAERGVTHNCAAATMRRLELFGHAVRRGLTCHDQRWYLRERAPPLSTISPPKIKPLAVINDRWARTTTVAKARMTLDPRAPAIVPRGVKITHCPSAADTRYTADPRIAGRGAITEDWVMRRQQS